MSRIRNDDDIRSAFGALRDATAPPVSTATLRRAHANRSGRTVSPRRPHRRPLVAVGVAAVVAAGAVALVPSTNVGPVGIARAAADLAQPDVLLHFKATTTYAGGGIENSETWQTPDGRLTHEIDDQGAGFETAYDQAGGTDEDYVRERNEILVATKENQPEIFRDEPSPFGTIANGNRSQVGDLPALLRLAVDGTDPNVRHVGRTTVRGVEVDQIQVSQQEQVADLSSFHCGTCDRGALIKMKNPPSLRDAPSKTITIVRDIYVRHDSALPVRLVQRPGYDQGYTTDFDDVQKLELNASTRPLLKLGEHPGANRTIRPPFDDSKADTAKTGN